MIHALFGERGRSVDGNVAALFAVLLFPVCLFVAFTLDMSRYVAANHEIQLAADSAALAGARAMRDASLTDNEIESRVQTAFAANFSNGQLGTRCGSISTTIDRVSESVQLDIECAVSKIFGSAFTGSDTMQFARDAESKITLFTMDVALVMDLSQSMQSGSRLANLRTGIKSLISTLITEETADRVRISMIPFGDAVNAGVYGNRALGREDTEDFHNDGSRVCVTRRTSPQSEYTDAAPSEFNYVGEATSWCVQPEIVPLTSDADALNQALDAMEAEGYGTAGHLGMAWAWYSISSNWSAIWPSESTPTPNNDPTALKVVILMTDGVFNMHYDFPSSARRINSARDIMALCRNMQQQGILIYIIGLDVEREAETASNSYWLNNFGPDIVLPTCAGHASRLTEPTDSSELVGIYESIAELLKIESLSLNQ
ncbi:MAG: pilus assembly protein TadG-related protein [Pseudomonadota bacterium]